MKNVINEDILRRIEIIAMVMEKPDYYTELDMVSHFKVSPQTIRLDAEKIREMGFDIHSRKGKFQEGRHAPGLQNNLICTYLALNKYDTIKNLGLIKKRFGKKTLNIFVKILKAIDKRTLLEIGYGKNPHGETIIKTVAPITLSRMNRNIYLFGFENDSPDRIRMYLLDKMSNIKFTEIKSKIKDIPDISEYFRTSWGAYTGGKEYNVKLKFSKETGDYIKDRFYIETQEFIDKSDHVIMTLKVKLSYEFISWVMGWGGEVEVLAPKALRDEVIERAEEILKLYR